MITGHCHCGAIAYEFEDAPPFAVRCNCSLCMRLGPLWIYARPEKVRFTGLHDQTIQYSHGPRNLIFHTCKTCGTTTHWSRRDGDTSRKMGVNLNLADLSVVQSIRVRHLDGADSWEFLD